MLKSRILLAGSFYCSSDLPLCSRCSFEGSKCIIEKLKEHCTKTLFTYVMDNTFCMVFALLINCWAAAFVELWNRKETVLQYRWNLFSIQIISSLRPDFAKSTQYRRISQITGKLEPYVPVRYKLCHVFITYVSIIFLIAIVLAALMGVTVFRLTLEKAIYSYTDDGYLRKQLTMVAGQGASVVLAIFILIFEKIYGKLSLWLTNLENPRTQEEYNNSYIYKRFTLNFINNYAPFFYIAFLKGRFISHPGDRTHYGLDLRLDECDLPNCVLDMSLSLSTVLFVKSMFFNIKEIVVPLFIMKRARKGKKNLTPWEEDYCLCPNASFYIIDEYMELMIQFGFLIYFGATFPLGPLLAFINNSIEIRIDAYKIIRLYRRPFPKRIANIGAWNGLMKIMIYTGIIFNTAVLCFTTNFVTRFVYSMKYDKQLKDYGRFQLSAFDVYDFPREDRPANFTGLCYYVAFRHGPYSKHKYQSTEMYWFVLAASFGFLLLFEFLVLMVMQIISVAIPNVPGYIKEKLRLERHELRELRLKTFSDLEKKMLAQETHQSYSVLDLHLKNT